MAPTKIPKAIIMEIMRSGVSIYAYACRQYIFRHKDKIYKRKTIILTLGGRYSPFAQIFSSIYEYKIRRNIPCIHAIFNYCSSDKTQISKVCIKRSEEIQILSIVR